MHGLMAPSDAARVTPELRADHVRFIDGLDTDNRVVMGGALNPSRRGALRHSDSTVVLRRCLAHGVRQAVPTPPGPLGPAPPTPRPRARCSG